MGESRVMEEPLQRLRSKANKCRDLASTALTAEARKVLTGLAEQYEQDVLTAQSSAPARRQRRPAFNWPLS